MPKKKAKKREGNILIRCSKDQHAEIQKAASNASMNMNAWLLQVAINAARGKALGV